MSNLPKFDTDTLCYIIENKLTPKDCEKILTSNKDRLIHKQIEEEGKVNNSLEMGDDDIIISPAKLIYSNRNACQDHFNYSLSNEDDDGMYEK